MREVSSAVSIFIFRGVRRLRQSGKIQAAVVQSLRHIGGVAAVKPKMYAGVFLPNSRGGVQIHREQIPADCDLAADLRGDGGQRDLPLSAQKQRLSELLFQLHQPFEQRGWEIYRLSAVRVMFSSLAAARN